MSDDSHLSMLNTVQVFMPVLSGYIKDITTTIIIIFHLIKKKSIMLKSFKRKRNPEKQT